jgi:acid stress chaperone HdeA
MRSTATAAVAAILCVAAVVGGCSGASNDGGDTTCAEFLASDGSGRDAIVAKMLKERNASNSSTNDVVAKRMLLDGLCKPADKQGDKISDLA